MEKEQKKLLLVAVSVGVFLLVTITVALIILTPKTQTQESAYYTSIPFQPAGNIQPNEQPVINNTQESNFNFNFENAETTAAIDTDNGNHLTIQIPKPSAAAVPNSAETVSSTATVASIVQNQAAAEPVRTTAGNTPAAQPAASSRSTAANTATAQQASTKTTTPSRPINDYWIQTGAFIAKVRADDAKELLESKGLTSIIENREIDGKTWYRVRLGPYTSETEANYWLALVKSIDGFNESQIRQTVRQ